jgi:hypothetical protein
MKKYKQLIKESNPDIISMTVPLFIRMLEWAREEAKTDVELHLATEKMLKKNKVLSTSDYDEIV